MCFLSEDKYTTRDSYPSFPTIYFHLFSLKFMLIRNFQGNLVRLFNYFEFSLSRHDLNSKEEQNALGNIYFPEVGSINLVDINQHQHLCYFRWMIFPGFSAQPKGGLVSTPSFNRIPGEREK